MTPDKLPHRVELQINREADDYREACPNVAPHIAYNAGATAWAPWKVKYDELSTENSVLEQKNIQIESRLSVCENEVYDHRKEYQELQAQAHLMADALEALLSMMPKGDSLRYFHAKEEVIFGRQLLQQFKDGKKEVAANKKTNMENNEPTASYTKGKWYLQEYTDAYTNIVRCNNGKHETIFIASTPQSSLPESRANAQLMSAAPDLLEALQEVIAISDRKHDAWDKAKAAIEKALGPWKDGKGKEVDDDFEKWKKENVTVMGEFDFIVGNKRVYGKKELRRIYEYLTNPTK